MKLSSPCLLALFLAVECCAGQSQPADPGSWIKLTTPKLELYTDASSAKARDLLQLFEKADSVALRRAGEEHAGSDKPLRIIAFANADEYRPFRLKRTALGHYLHARDRHYVVLADADPEHYEAAVHEYTHYAVNRAGLHLPLWLNEGIADLYSTTSTKTGTPVLGGPLAGRFSTLTSGHVLHLRDLFAAGRESSFYSDPASTPLFYAESWAFTRFLALDSRYASQFPELLSQVSAGRSSADALWSIYGKTPEQFEAELPASIGQMQGVRPVATGSEAKDSEMNEAKVSEFERLLVWADLLAAHPSTASRAKELLLEISKKYPGTPRTEELLGHIAWMTKQSDEARIHWAKAVEGGSRDFESFYRLALLLHEGGAPPSEVITLMEKAIEVKPGCDEAIYNLGVLKYGEGQYEGASQILLSLQNVAPEQAYTYYSVLAYCDMKMKTFGRAKAFLLKAAESARTADEQAENSRMLRFAAVRAD